MNQTFTTYQEAPSNIAIVKYWGKKGVQEPLNPSLSFTLNKALTKTSVEYQPNAPKALAFTFEGREMPGFLPKLNAFIERITSLLPYLSSGSLKIDSTNTFPHSSGIASSASSMAALAKALTDIAEQQGIHVNEKAKLTSELARLGSGSACRSTGSGWILWGETPLVQTSSQKYGTHVNERIAPIFTNLHDSILVIRKGSKAVSSTVGHSLMTNHPYQAGRLQQANKNIEKLLQALEKGNFELFAEVCEEEALSLHGLMMSSSPGYMLMEPHSLQAIQRIKEFKEATKLPLTYTLDAGPNIHLIYPDEQKEAIVPFIKEKLQPLCEDHSVIYDQISMNNSVTRI